MNTVPVEEIEVERLKTEILANARVTALPCNMSDEWLMLLDRDFTEALEHPDAPCIPRTRSALFAPMAVIMCLLAEKQNTRELAVPLDLLHQHCQKYQTELQLELVRRETDAPLTPATLETILTNRDVLQELTDKRR